MSCKTCKVVLEKSFWRLGETSTCSSSKSSKPDHSALIYAASFDQKKHSAGKCPLGKVWILFYCYEYLFYGCDSHSYNLYRLGLRLRVVPVLVLSCCRDEWTSTCSPGPDCLSYSSQTSWELLQSVWQKVMVVQMKKGRVWAWHCPRVFWDVELHGKFAFGGEFAATGTHCKPGGICSKSI